MPSRLLLIRQWSHGNLCTWEHDVWLHIAGTNEPDIYILNIFALNAYLSGQFTSMDIHIIPNWFPCLPGLTPKNYLKFLYFPQ